MQWFDPLFHDVKRYGLAFVFAFLAPAAFLYLIPPFVKGEEAVWLMIGTFVVGIVISVIVFWRLSRHPDRDEEPARIKALQQRLMAGEVLGRERKVPLSDKDRGDLQNLKRMAIVGLTMALGLALYIINRMAAAKLDDVWAIAITVVGALLFTFLIYRYTLIIDRVLQKGEKSMIEGTITNRYTRSIGRTTERYFDIGNITVKVFRHHYLYFHVGDSISIEVLRDFGDWNLRGKKE